jgi:hypothetical protein
MGKHKNRGYRHQLCIIASNAHCKEPVCPEKKRNIYASACEIKGWTDEMRMSERGCNKQTVKKKFQAHHVLPIASAIKAFSTTNGGKEHPASDAFSETKWCINKEANMIGLPVFGHTISYYIKKTPDWRKALRSSTFIESLITGEGGAPCFANLPQHDWDHLKYNDEITKKLIALARGIEQRGHDNIAEDIASALDSIAASYKNTLKRRGERKGGTHASWRNATSNRRYSCKPFSMAKRSEVSTRKLPKINEKYTKILKLLLEDSS